MVLKHEMDYLLAGISRVYAKNVDNSAVKNVIVRSFWVEEKLTINKSGRTMPILRVLASHLTGTDQTGYVCVFNELEHLK